MKNSLLPLSAALVLSLAGCTAEEAPPAAPPAEGGSAAAMPSALPSLENAVVLTVNVQGMTCDGCVQAVTQAIAKVDGVVSCSVSLEAGQAVVHADSDDARAGVVAAIEDLGYETGDSDTAGS